MGTDDQHVEPLGDEREHVTSGELCPCMPMVLEQEGGGRVIRHNSYDGREIGEVCAKALYLLGVALANHSHTWTPEERDAFEHAEAVLRMHYDLPDAPGHFVDSAPAD
jgi:hypothetical protein